MEKDGANMEFKNSSAGNIVLNLVKTIHENRNFLSEIDGKIGDGDHGINMDKGFTLCASRLDGKHFSMSEGFKILGQTLLTDIGGSMGPLYGVFFDELASASEDLEKINAEIFETMFKSAVAGVMDIGGANRGDKTLLDTLLPAVDAYSDALESGKNFSECLEILRSAAKEGWQSTENMVAKMGRASRLGERSRGVLDAGATSCYLIVDSIAASIQELIK